MDRPLRLLDQMRDALRARYHSLHTERAYLLWVGRFTHFHHMRYPAEMGGPEINASLTHLEVRENVSASTQNQASAALFSLYRHILAGDLENLEGVIRAGCGPTVPVEPPEDH